MSHASPNNTHPNPSLSLKEGLLSSNLSYPLLKREGLGVSVRIRDYLRINQPMDERDSEKNKTPIFRFPIGYDIK
jgi:hypothetical protein